MLEVRARVQKKLDEVEALKATGLSEREIQQEAEGGSAILNFLKEHDLETRYDLNLRWLRDACSTRTINRVPIL